MKKTKKRAKPLTAYASPGENGPYYKIIPAKRCLSELRGRQCQGVKGHDGWCWFYSGSGWLERWPRTRAEQRKTRVGHESIPPGHERYVHPKDMMKDSFLNNYKRVQLKRKPRDWDD